MNDTPSRRVLSPRDHDRTEPGMPAQRLMVMRHATAALCLLVVLSGCNAKPDAVGEGASVPSAPSATPQAVTLDFYHCAVRPFSLDGEWWMVQDAIFDEASKPADLSGTGTATRDGDTLRYIDNAGGSLTFEAVAEEVTRRCA